MMRRGIMVSVAFAVAIFFLAVFALSKLHIFIEGNKQKLGPLNSEDLSMYPLVLFAIFAGLVLIGSFGIIRRWFSSQQVADLILPLGTIILLAILVFVGKP